MTTKEIKHSSLEIVLDNTISVITPNSELALALAEIFPDCDIYDFIKGEIETKDSFILIEDYRKNMYGWY